MHKVIRDTALWIASEYDGKKNEILVQEGIILSAAKITKLKEVHRILIWDNSFKLTSPHFPNLFTRQI